MQLLLSQLNKAKQSGDLHEWLDASIANHQASEIYRRAVESDAFYTNRNRTLPNLTMEITVEGSMTPITVKADNVITSNLFRRIVNQPVATMLFNPIQIGDIENDIKKTLGKNFDENLEIAQSKVSRHTVIYGFLNLVNGQHQIQYFTVKEFIEIVDDRTSELVAGIRFWTTGDSNTSYIQLYEVEGYTEVEKTTDERGNVTYTETQHSYLTESIQFPDGERQILSTRNYGRLPIVAWESDPDRIGKFTDAIKMKILMYELVDTLYIDEFIKTKVMQYRFTGFGGNVDDLMFQKAMIEVLGIVTSEREITSHSQSGVDITSVDFPYQAKEKIKEGLKNDLYEDADVTNIHAIIGGNIVATAIRKASLAEENDVRLMQGQFRKFMNEILELMGVGEQEIKFVNRNLTGDDEVQARIVKTLVDSGVPEEIAWANYLTDKEVQRALELRDIKLLGADVEIARANQLRQQITELRAEQVGMTPPNPGDNLND